MASIHNISCVSEATTACGVTMQPGQSLQLRSWVQEATGELSDIVQYLRLGTLVIDQDGTPLGLQDSVDSLNAMWSNRAGSAMEMAELSTESVYGHMEVSLPTGTSWVIDHTLPVAHPSVVVLDSAGSQIEIDVAYSASVPKRIILTASNAFSGTAILS